MQTIEYKLSLAYRSLKLGYKPKDIAILLKVHRATVYRWKKLFRYIGLKRTIISFLKARKGKRKGKVTSSIKRIIWDLRIKHFGCDGLHLQHYLQKNYGIRLSIPYIYKILKEKFVIQSRYKEYKYGEAPKGMFARDVIQADTVDIGDLYLFTFIDTYTRECYVSLKDTLESSKGKEALLEALKYFKGIRLLQNDGGPEFKGEYYDYVVNSPLIHSHRVSRPYKKNEQSFIESFNRTVRKACVGWKQWKKEEKDILQEKVKGFIIYYNEVRAHSSLNMRTPKEFVATLS